MSLPCEIDSRFFDSMIVLPNLLDFPLTVTVHLPNYLKLTFPTRLTSGLPARSTAAHLEPVQVLYGAASMNGEAPLSSVGVESNEEFARIVEFFVRKWKVDNRALHYRATGRFS
jgi:hypothetical protein